MFGIIWSFVTNAVVEVAWAFHDLHYAIGTWRLIFSLPVIWAVYRLFLAPVLGEAVGSSDGSLKPGSIVAGRIREKKREKRWEKRLVKRRALRKSGMKTTAVAGKKKKG